MPRSRRNRTTSLGLTLVVVAVICVVVLASFSGPPSNPSKMPAVAGSPSAAVTALAAQSTPPAGLVTPTVPQSPAATAPNTMSVVVLDVGQGDSLLVRSPAGETMLIDAGDSERVAEAVIVPTLHKLGVSRLDYMVLTHPHQDHVGGMPTVLSALPTDTAVLSGQVSTNLAYRNWLSLIQQGKAKALKAGSGTVLDIGAGASAEVLNPPDRLFDNDNDNSLVLRLVYDQVAFLLMGDAERDAIAALLRANADLKSAVLKVGHHGSSNATTDALLNAADPRYAAISVGASNPFGHPHRETMELLNKHGVKVYRTDRDGSITIETDGKSVTVSTTKG